MIEAAAWPLVRSMHQPSKLGASYGLHICIVYSEYSLDSYQAFPLGHSRCNYAHTHTRTHVYVRSNRGICGIHSVIDIRLLRCAVFIYSIMSLN